MSRVLIVRGDGIGDALALVPLIAALREAGHAVGAVLSTRNADVFARAALAERYVLDRIPWPKHGSTGASYASAVRRVREARYDAALIASEEPEAYRLAADAGIERRIGFANGWERMLKTLWIRRMCTAVRYRPASAQRAAEHEVETLFTLGAGLHSEVAPTRDLARLAPLVLDERPPRAESVVLQLTRKWERLLGAAALADLCRELARRPGLQAVVAPDERDRFAGLIPAGTELRSPSGLEEWKRMIAAAAVLVTPDTGAAHAAGMLGTPTVDVFPDDATLDRDARRWRPWAAPFRALAPRADRGGAFAREIVEAVYSLS
jgi:ADP-heptose:LPS heptosyltransferase